MRKEVRVCAEYYALGAISFEQLGEGLTWAEYMEALEYARYFSSKYNQWVRDREEIEAHDIIDSDFTDDIDNRCLHAIWEYCFEYEFKVSHMSPFQFCLEWDIVPDDILNRYIDDCCIIEE